MTNLQIKKSFIEKMWPIADEEFIRSGIYPHITIVQSAHESGWGLSGLTMKANNLFGFTGESWEKEGKPVIRLPTKEYINKEWVTVQRPFRAYASWADSIQDWSALMHKQRYAMALESALRGEMAFFSKWVAEAGYATDPRYGDKLMELYAGITNLLPPIHDFTSRSGQIRLPFTEME